MLKTLRKSPRLLLLTGAALMTTAGVAFAAIPGSNGVINGCYEKRTGILRVIDAEAGKRCLAIETPISWNQGGAAGPQGPAGNKGPTGDKGPQGDPGVAGDKGLTGDKGPTGDPGPVGDKGPQGDQGVTGDKGLTGDQGPIGDPGPVGDKGRQGDPGDKGPVGDKGPTGDKGPQGDPGATTNFTKRLSERTTLPANTSTFISVTCLAGERAVGGGATNVNAPGVYLKQTTPSPSESPTPTGWTVTYENTTAVDRSGHAHVICAGP